jgi:pimeloyl-ACP methyl ester carboxylesterase
VLLAAACSSSPATIGSTPAPPTSPSEITTTLPPPTTLPSTTTVAGSTGAEASTETIDVEILTPDLMLQGTLRLPSGTRPAPAVILIHGSGPISREGTLPGQLNMVFPTPIPVFTEVAEALRDRGFAVLTYDKRSCGPFNGCSDNEYPIPGDDLTVDTFIADARAAVDFLRSQPAVDPGGISVAGHSQGAQFVTILLEGDPALASGIMIAGPYRSIDEILQAQLDFTLDLLEGLGMSEEESLGSAAVRPLVAMVEGVAAIRRGSDEPVAGATAAFWRSWLDLHERSLSAGFRITQPILVLNGELDWNIAPIEARAWGEFLDGVGAVHDVVILPCVTHALNCVSEADPSAITPADVGDEVAPEVIDALAAFLVGAAAGS